MITNFLLAHPWMSPTALVLLVLLGPIVGRQLVPHRSATWWLLGLSAVPVAASTLVPVNRRVEEFCTVQWMAPTFGRVELIANVVLFVSPTLLFAIGTRRPLVAALAGSAVSAGVELVQAIVPAIGRSCDTTDWTSNTVGVLLGAVLGAAALRQHARS